MPRVTSILFSRHHAEIVINSAFTAVSFSLVANHGVNHVLENNVRQIEEYFNRALPTNQKSAGSLSPVKVLKVIVRQSIAVDPMVNDRSWRVTDGNLRIRKPVRQFNIFGSAGSSGAETLVESSYPLEYAPTYEEVGSVQGMKCFELFFVL
jgi:hypothetical protein